jgi:hypothetical protein
MSRAGCDVDHAERALGHLVGGVRGVYDRHAFKVEKARVFEALGEAISAIVETHPVGANIYSARGRPSIGGTAR